MKKLTALIGLYIAKNLFSTLFSVLNDRKKGNKSKFHPNVLYLEKDEKLNGKKILVLGSSITYGAASHGVSFVEFLKEESKVDTTKEAISGTTLAGLEKNSYVQRIKKEYLKKNNYDLLICQLSTNDSRFKKALGEISLDYELENFNTETTIGAMEYIISYAKNTWDTPVLFYTCIRKSDPYYEHLINVLYKLKDKWDIEILDVWNNLEANNLKKYDKTLFADDAHPTLKGYRYVYFPLFKEKIKCIFS